jgi:hypothetical protein
MNQLKERRQSSNPSELNLEKTLLYNSPRRDRQGSAIEEMRLHSSPNSVIASRRIGLQAYAVNNLPDYQREISTDTRRSANGY